MLNSRLRWIQSKIVKLMPAAEYRTKYLFPSLRLIELLNSRLWISRFETHDATPDLRDEPWWGHSSVVSKAKRYIPTLLSAINFDKFREIRKLPVFFRLLILFIANLRLLSFAFLRFRLLLGEVRIRSEVFPSERLRIMQTVVIPPHLRCVFKLTPEQVQAQVGPRRLIRRFLPSRRLGSFLNPQFYFPGRSFDFCELLSFLQAGDFRRAFCREKRFGLASSGVGSGAVVARAGRAVRVLVAALLRRFILEGFWNCRFLSGSERGWSGFLCLGLMTCSGRRDCGSRSLILTIAEILNEILQCDLILLFYSVS